MSDESLWRFNQALEGVAVDPPVVGLTFLPETALSDRAGGESAAAALGRVCADAQLDFLFVPAWQSHAERVLTAAKSACAAPVWVVRGVLNPALDELGVVTGLRATITAPERLRPALDGAVEDALEAAARGVALGAGAITVADDIMGREGPLVTPDYIRTELLPRYGRIARSVRDAGLPCILHCDSDSPLPLADLREAGFAAVHPGGMSDAAFERLLVEGRREGVRIVGGVMTADLESGLPHAVITGVRLGMLARGGGLLLADDGGVTTYGQYAALLASFVAARGPE